MSFRVKPAHLANLPVSEIAITDGSGDYVSDWIDAADTLNTATPSYVQSTDISRTGRYFRYEVNNATNSGAWVSVVIRKVN